MLNDKFSQDTFLISLHTYLKDRIKFIIFEHLHHS